MKLISFGRYPERFVMSATDSLPNWKGSVSEAETSDDGEPRLQIVEPDNSTAAVVVATPERRFDRTTFQKTTPRDDTNNASDAVESLLMLGRDIWSRSSSSSLLPTAVTDLSVSKGRRFSSGEVSLSHDEKGVVTYYQKMRERNNEASKRCRLKRRLKAESLESQMSMLAMTNKMLKQRINRMETISKTIKDGINQIQTSNCSCLQTVAHVQQVNRDHCDRQLDSMHLTTSELLKTSKSYRDQNPELLLPPSSSDDDLSADLSSTNSPVPPVCVPVQPPSFPGFVVKMSPQTPTLTRLPSTPLLSLSSPPTPTTTILPRQKTALDVINDTILKSLGSSSSTPTSPSPLPLNLVKILPSVKTESAHPFLLFSPTSTTHGGDVAVVKREPETTFANGVGVGVDPMESCVATAAGGGPCKGPLHNLNKLTSYLNTLTGLPVSTDDGSSAMERAIIKSRMRIPFWKADEFPSFICDGHRRSIVHRREECDFECVVCGKKKAKKVKSVMFLVTYRMSLENHIKNGSILPIGHLVCGFCKDKHLKGIDAGCSQIVTGGCDILNNVPTSTTMTSTNSVSIRPALALKRPASLDSSSSSSSSDQSVNHLPVKIRPSPPCFSTARTSTEVQVIIQPVQKETPQAHPISLVQPGSHPNNVRAPPPPPPAPVDNIFNKISRLNEALHSINPKYKPIGFSITSIESCSSAILQDAIFATETAVSTLMSVIAPGQESFLWESIKPILDKKHVGGNININNNNNNSSSNSK